MLIKFFSEGGGGVFQWGGRWIPNKQYFYFFILQNHSLLIITLDFYCTCKLFNRYNIILKQKFEIQANTVLIITDKSKLVMIKFIKRALVKNVSPICELFKRGISLINANTCTERLWNCTALHLLPESTAERVN